MDYNNNVCNSSVTDNDINVMYVKYVVWIQHECVEWSQQNGHVVWIQHECVEWSVSGHSRMAT